MSPGSPKGTAGNLALSHARRIGFLSATHPVLRILVSTLSLYWSPPTTAPFPFCGSPNCSLAPPTYPVQGGGNLRVSSESSPGGPQPGGGRHGQQEAAESAAPAAATWPRDRALQRMDCWSEAFLTWWPLFPPLLLTTPIHLRSWEAHLLTSEVLCVSRRPAQPSPAP